MFARIRLAAVRTNSHRVRMLSSSPIVRSDALFVHHDTPNNNPKVPFAFDAKNMEEAKKIISKYPPQYKKAAMIPLLHLAQKQHGWTPISVMNYVAKLLEVAPMRVYEVATFYTMFNRNPVGKYFLQVCTTTPCELCGASKIVQTIEKHLGIKVGQTTEDKLFTLVEVECAGACVNAPVISVNDDYFEDLTPESTVKLLDGLKAGKPVTRGPANGRKNCEPLGGQTTLKEAPPGPGFMMRSDL